MHYYKFNIADWSLGTSHLSLEEESIYFRLINHYYDTESPIPLETQSVFRRLRFGSHSDIALSILDEFFKKTEKGFVHLRCEEMLKEYRKTVNKNRRNGAKGGRPRKDAAPSQSEEKPSGLSVGTQEEPKHNPNQEPLTTNHKPITIFKDKAKAKRFVPVYSDWNNWDWPDQPDEDVFDSWLAARKKIKGGISELSFKRLGKEFCKATNLNDCLAEMELRGWKGFKSDWMTNNFGSAGNGQNKQNTGSMSAVDKVRAAIAERNSQESEGSGRVSQGHGSVVASYDRNIRS